MSKLGEPSGRPTGTELARTCGSTWPGRPNERDHRRWKAVDRGDAAFTLPAALSVGVRRTFPANDRQAFCRIKHLLLAPVEAVGCKHLLRSPRGHLRKDRSATRQSHIRRPRQVENVITVQENPEHLRTPNHANDTVWR